MKKFLFLLLTAGAAVGGVVLKKRMEAAGNEQALWKQATDPVG